MSFIKRIIASLYRRCTIYFVLRGARSASRRNIASLSRNNLLVICYGNIYRSPYVEFRLRALLDKSVWSVRSAGFYPTVDRRSPPDYIEMISRRGVDLNMHRSKVLTSKDVDWADLIIIMDRKNWHLLNKFGQEVDRKIVWIGACLDNESVEIDDPYGSDSDSVEEIVNKMDSAVAALVRSLSRD